MPTAQTDDPRQLGFDADRLARIDRHFRRYVDDGRLPGWQVLVSRHQQLAYTASYGMRDIDAGTPWSDDTVVRLFSMTKPITAVAAMILYEQGLFDLNDPVAKFIPAFGDARVYRSGSVFKPVSVPATEPMRMWHLLTHTSGLTYGWHHQSVTDALYRKGGWEWGAPPDTDLAAACDLWAAMPLAFEPGSEWLYGVSSDVLGRVVEVISGVALSEFFERHILGPLKMTDTAFEVDESQRGRVARLYSPFPGSEKAFLSPLENSPTDPPVFLSGGGGLWGTADDYLRFCHMLLGRGELDGERLLGSRTVDFMTRNHLPGGVDLETFGRPGFSESNYRGMGFGLGVSVVIDPIANGALTSAGTYSWGGAASTVFWCDPSEQIAVIFLTQLLPSSTHPIRPELRQLVYSSMVD